MRVEAGKGLEEARRRIAELRAGGKEECFIFDPAKATTIEPLQAETIQKTRSHLERIPVYASRHSAHENSSESARLKCRKRVAPFDRPEHQKESQIYRAPLLEEPW